ncbi:MAG: hypothetical protein AB7P40_04375 [Chloroflexota bacterium]
MTPETPTFFDRLRAGTAAALARMASGARRLEDWSSRGTRPVLVALIAVAILAAGSLAVMSMVGHGSWFGRDAHAERFERGPHPRAIGKPEGKPHGRPVGKPDGRPVPPPPPGPPAPPAPPAP